MSDNNFEILKNEIKIFLNKYLNNQSTLLEKSIIYSADLLNIADLTNVYTIYNLGKNQIKNYKALTVAYTLNLISIYIYYDLPSMLNNSMRNNKPNIHVYFNEAISRLCMISLSSLQFEILSSSFKENEQIFNIFDRYSSKIIDYFNKSDIYNNLNENFNNKSKNIIENEMNNRILLVTQSMLESIFVLSNKLDYYEKNIEQINELIVHK